MDVADQPNNWPRRIEGLCNLKVGDWILWVKVKVSDEQVLPRMRDLKAQGVTYVNLMVRLLTSIGRAAARERDRLVLMLAAHPAKFKEVVDDILGVLTLNFWPAG